MRNDAVHRPDPPQPRWARGPVRPFRFPQYRVLALAVSLGLMAAGMWLVALVWLVIEIGGGPAQLSLVAVGPALGIVITALVGGVLADRVPQRKILIAVFVVKAAMVALATTLAWTGHLEFWHLALIGLGVGMADGFEYPAYSALLPSIVPPRDLLAANGIEGVIRPAFMQAAGPALAGAVIASYSPTAALGVVAVLEAATAVFLLRLRPTPLRRDMSTEQAHPLRAAAADLADGFRYMARTPWLLSTLLFGSAITFVLMGPIEVLIPFVIKEIPGGGPGAHALVLAAFGAGGAVGSLAMASRTLPRRYLTVMMLMWGLGALPLAIVGLAGSIAVIVVAVFIVGVLFSAPTVIWGTLLQRRVPPHLLGRVSSLDFFVSLVFMPLSMAIAGPVALAVGLVPTFVLAGTVPIVAAVVAIVVARMPRDEIANPLDALVEVQPVPADDPDASQKAAQ